MTYQNRVDPWGNLNAINSRGAWLGNRGVLHNEQQKIVSPWKRKAWVTCKLEYKGSKREIFSPHKYSELFFLDEATALAAGHRPCGQCRRKRYNEFKSKWCIANPDISSSTSIPIDLIDKQLHIERAVRGVGKVTFQTDSTNIPDGTFIELSGKAFLRWNGSLFRWSAYGYSNADDTLSLPETVSVLTPRSIMRMFRQGFKPQIHESVETGLSTASK